MCVFSYAFTQDGRLGEVWLRKFLTCCAPKLTSIEEEEEEEEEEQEEEESSF
jgi:hypothetical protein